MFSRQRCLALVMTFFTAPAMLQARITRITITSRAAAFDGQRFGAAGAYEKIKGIAAGEIDPKDRRNAVITDLEFAPKNSAGRVEYRTNFTLVKPVDMGKAPGVLLYNIVNRGNHDGPAEWHIGGDPGDGFLYKMGHVVLWSGWQGDIPLATTGDREGIDVPVAKNADGSAVTGPVWERYSGVGGNTQSLPGAAGPDAGKPRHHARETDFGRVRDARRRQERRRDRSRRRTGPSPIAARFPFPARRTPRASASRTASIRRCSTSWSTPPRIRSCWASAWPPCAT